MLDQDLSEEGFPNSQQGFSSEIELRRRILWRKGGNICHQVYRQVVKEIRQR